MIQPTNYPVFTKEMKQTHTILLPSMLPIHFAMLQDIFLSEGYSVEILTNCSNHVVEQGLKYVHNDTCYPALLVIGQMIDALKSGRYDLSKVALMITQTGGGCRASNYIHLLRKALVKAGFGYIPVVSLNFSGLEKDSGFQFTLPMIRKILALLTYGDILMLLHNQVKAYEVNIGQSQILVEELIKYLCSELRQNRSYKLSEMKPVLDKIVSRFASIPINRVKKCKVGIVGEIYVKYASLGNNNLEDFLSSQNCEVMVPGLFGFMLFKLDNRLEDIKLYGGSGVKKWFVQWIMSYVTKAETMVCEAVRGAEVFVVPTQYQQLKKLVKGVVGYGNKMGEGWLLTAEMMELIEQGYGNIVCAQPFGCLPNHIVGKGMIRKIHNIYKNANIVPIDYDPSATRVNQENRIKLMLAVANDKMSEVLV